MQHETQYKNKTINHVGIIIIIIFKFASMPIVGCEFTTLRYACSMGGTSQVPQQVNFYHREDFKKKTKQKKEVTKDGQFWSLRKISIHKKIT